MDDITILKNRLAYFSNRVSYKSDFEEIDFKIDYETEHEPEYDDEIDEEYYKEYMKKQKEEDFVKKVKQFIRNEQIDLGKAKSKELAKLLEISNNELKELFPKYYDEFMKEQELVYKKQGKEQEDDEEEEKEKMKFGKKMKKLLKDLKK